MKKKILTAFMALCLIFAGTLSAIPAYAANQDVKLVWRDLSTSYNCMHTDYVQYWPHARIRQYTANGRTAFCIQANRAIRDKNGKSMTEYDINELTMSVSVRTASTDDSLQSKIAYLGYYANTHNDENYAFTQMFIWQSLPLEDQTSNGRDSQGRYRSYFEDSSVNSRYESWKSNIQAKINSWYVRPSFDASTQTIKAGTSTTLTDSRGALADYNTFSYTKDGVTISHSKGSNTLSVTAARDCTKKSVNMYDADIKSAGGTKYSNAYDTAYTYTEDETQNMATYGPVDPVPLRINFNVQLISGKVEINKEKAPDAASDEVLPEEGAEFEIYLKSAGSYAAADADHRDVITTAADGKAVTKDLPWGVYTVHQTKAPAGHIMAEDFDVDIANTEDGKIYTYDIRNETVKANIQIVKKDAETGKIVPLAGTEYELINLTTGKKIESADKSGNFITDETGQITLPEPLYYGPYRLNEIHAPYGYVLGESVEFEVTGTDATVPTIVVEQKNKVQMGILNVRKFGEVLKEASHTPGEPEDKLNLKFDDDGLEGAEFEMTAAEDIVTPEGTLRYEKGELVETITTGEDGRAVSEPHFLGKYILTETKAPRGFLLDKTPHEVEIAYAGDTVEVTSVTVNIENAPKIGYMEFMTKGVFRDRRSYLTDSDVPKTDDILAEPLLKYFAVMLLTAILAIAAAAGIRREGRKDR